MSSVAGVRQACCPADAGQGCKGVAVSVERVSQRYGSRRAAPIDALRDVSLTLREGEFVSIVGPSGCGKSTLLLAIAGLQKPTSGRIVIGGEEVTGPSRAMGIAFQRDNLMEWRSVLRNVLVQADLRGWRRGSATSRARELLDMVGLSQFERSYPRELSGGMRQRVALCRALVHDPQLLLLDEPFGAVDAMTREQLNLDVGRLCAASGVTTLLVTHDINEAAFMSGRVVVMTSRPGKIAGVVEIGAPAQRDGEFRGHQVFVNACMEIRHLLAAQHAPGDGSGE